MVRRELHRHSVHHPRLCSIHHTSSVPYSRAALTSSLALAMSNRIKIPSEHRFSKQRHKVPHSSSIHAFQAAHRKPDTQTRMTRCFGRRGANIQPNYCRLSVAGCSLGPPCPVAGSAEIKIKKVSHSARSKKRKWRRRRAPERRLKSLASLVILKCSWAHRQKHRTQDRRDRDCKERDHGPK